MKDTPIPAKIILNLADKLNNGEIFIGLSGTLYQQRLIFGEPRELRKNNGKLELIVIFLDKKSFENWLTHSCVIEYWEKIFDKYLIEKPLTLQENDVIIKVEDIFNCSCETLDFLLLYGRRYGFSNELNCSNCSGNISYSKVPLEIKIEQWQKHYQRIYRNWLDSGILEASALKQLKNYKNGKLNVEGQKIRKELSEHFKVEVYLEYFVEEPDIEKTCVICGDKGIDSGLKRPGKICKKCHTVFDYCEK